MLSTPWIIVSMINNDKSHSNSHSNKLQEEFELWDTAFGLICSFCCKEKDGRLFEHLLRQLTCHHQTADFSSRIQNMDLLRAASAWFYAPETRKGIRLKHMNDCFWQQKILIFAELVFGKSEFPFHRIWRTHIECWKTTSRDERPILPFLTRP